MKYIVKIRNVKQGTARKEIVEAISQNSALILTISSLQENEILIEAKKFWKNSPRAYKDRTDYYKNIGKKIDNYLKKRELYYKENKDILKERRKLYYNENKDILLKRSKLYYINNKDIVKERRKEKNRLYYIKNQDIIKQKNKLRYKKNKEKCNPKNFQ